MCGSLARKETVGELPWTASALCLSGWECVEPTKEGVCIVLGMVAPASPRPGPADDAAQLGLAVIAEAAAVSTRDDEVIHSAAENLQDTIDVLIDEPMTDRQEDVVHSLGTVAGSLLAGVSGALAAQQGVPVEKVLGGSARVLLAKAQLASDMGADET